MRTTAEVLWITRYCLWDMAWKMVPNIGSLGIVGALSGVRMAICV
ncbi:unnamed protein product [Oppiella nova]|uniref:Uncharacterized protein n=1 Tax=Oppiella nova TaxID=334625 RepID=A0A7R9MQ86_9ACAR|nr:unnamed protein product [Oppiella nova]CAG2181217.1 unnamed protein product [Oppiella nova]